MDFVSFDHNRVIVSLVLAPSVCLSVPLSLSLSLSLSVSSRVVARSHA
jgi:hypothetical protein